jgi:hypothetical protein
MNLSNLRMISYLQSITKYNFKQSEEFHFTSHDGHFARASKPFICMHPRARAQQTTCTVSIRTQDPWVECMHLRPFI